MKYNDYICETCGFNSLEQPGAYRCPVCGDKMTVANHFLYNNTRTTHDDNAILTILMFLFGLPFCIMICIAILRSIWGVVPGIVLFVILLMFIPEDTKNKCIPIEDDEESD